MAAKRRYQKCAVKHCSNNIENQPDMQFFRFPRNYANCSIWIIKVNNPDLSDCPLSSVRNNYTVCARHFERHCFQTEERKKLNRNAVPELHLKLELLDESNKSFNLKSTSAADVSVEQEATLRKRRKVVCDRSISSVPSTSAGYPVQAICDISSPHGSSSDVMQVDPDNKYTESVIHYSRDGTVHKKIYIYIVQDLGKPEKIHSEVVSQDNHNSPYAKRSCIANCNPTVRP